jgi:hypothetical protein
LGAPKRLGGQFMFHLERGRPVHGLLVCFTGTCKQLLQFTKVIW